MKRREFLKVAGAAAGACPLASQRLLAASAGDSRDTELPRRVLGRTGEKVSTIVFPGLAMIQQEQDECTAAVRRIFERGVNYFDVAPAYGNGTAEVRMGIALQGLDRSRLFLACKTKMRDKDGARQELERSLQRLKTDHFDLYQMHHIRAPEEVQKACGPGGAIETFLKAKEEGKVRFFGFSAHTTKGALEALKAYSFDTAMFPISFAEYFQFGFGKAVLEEAGRRGTVVLGMKALHGGARPKGVEPTRKWWYRTVEKDDEVALAVRFTLSQPGVIAAVPPSFIDLTDKAISAAQAFQPITEAELATLRQMSVGRGSVFQDEENRVNAGQSLRALLHQDCPHGHCYPVNA
ncbi:MAG: aldo/keto reductase [Sedimentisphaerales bacterium]|nr:aldo/keto reductase [Sedimentisphaerales bacterium]